MPLTAAPLAKIAIREMADIAAPAAIRAAAPAVIRAAARAAIGAAMPRSGRAAGPAAVSVPMQGNCAAVSRGWHSRSHAAVPRSGGRSAAPSRLLAARAVVGVERARAKRERDCDQRDRNQTGAAHFDASLAQLRRWRWRITWRGRRRGVSRRGLSARRYGRVGRPARLIDKAPGQRNAMAFSVHALHVAVIIAPLSTVG